MSRIPVFSYFLCWELFIYNFHCFFLWFLIFCTAIFHGRSLISICYSIPMLRINTYLHRYSLGNLEDSFVAFVNSNRLCKHLKYYNRYFGVAVYVQCTGLSLGTPDRTWMWAANMYGGWSGCDCCIRTKEHGLWNKRAIRPAFVTRHSNCNNDKTVLTCIWYIISSTSYTL